MSAFRSIKLLKLTKILSVLALLLLPVLAFPQTATPNGVSLPGMAINFGQGVNLVDSIEVLLLFTIITLAPSILILCTSFTRILIVLSFMRQAIGTQNMPPNQVLVGFSLFLSILIPSFLSFFLIYSSLNSISSSYSRICCNFSLHSGKSSKTNGGIDSSLFTKFRFILLQAVWRQRERWDDGERKRQKYRRE